MSLSPGKTKHVTLDQQVAEAEGYYRLLQEQVQGLSRTMNGSEEAGQLRGTAKDMLEALRQCIHIIKDSELTETVTSLPSSLEPTPPPLEADMAGHAPMVPPTGETEEEGASPRVERSAAIAQDEAAGDLRSANDNLQGKTLIVTS